MFETGTSTYTKAFELPVKIQDKFSPDYTEIPKYGV